MARARVTAVVLGLAVCGALGSAASAAAGTGSISGHVTDAGGPLAGIQVCDFEPKGATEEGCTTTDGSGDYQLTGLNPGSYTVTFRAPRGVNLVTQYYSGALTFLDAAPVAVAGSPVPSIDAEMHKGGTISGTATEVGTGSPIQGLSVCANANGGLYSGCTTTGVGGQYSITGLPADPEYHVEFEAFGELNYLAQSYDEKEGLDSWDEVAVVVDETTDEIDAVMKPGAQISGNVSEVGTGAALAGIEVCALDPADDPRAREFEKCAFTDGAGNYTIRSLRSGTFVVVFSRKRAFFDSDGYFEQFYDGVSSEAEATRITIGPPDTRTGVDARLVTYIERPKPQPIVVSIFPTPRPALPLHCKKGFHKKWVKGKRRCVRVHKKHHRHSGGHGPHAVATGH